MDKGRARTVAIIQARMGSSRLPGKILLPLAGRPSLERMVERVRRARLDEVVVATTRHASDDAVEAWGKAAGVAVYRGSEDDVLTRVLEAARRHRAEVIVQLTGDCPLIDPGLIDELLAYYASSGCDYVSNALPRRSFARGFDTQIFSLDVLETAGRRTTDPADREHVSLYIYEHPQEFKLGGIQAPPELDAPHVRLCVDTDADYRVVSAVYDHWYPKKPAFDRYDIMRFLNGRPDLLRLNADVRQKAPRG